MGSSAAVHATASEASVSVFIGLVAMTAGSAVFAVAGWLVVVAVLGVCVAPWSAMATG